MYSLDVQDNHGLHLFVSWVSLMQKFYISGNLVDISGRSMNPVRMHIQDGKIHTLEALHTSSPDSNLPYILPGFIDAHVHIESSMLIPSEFAKLAVVHGTVATVSDPHEIANVCGIEGVRFMIENGKKVPFHFCFGAPSCVPATHFETAGASIDSSEVEALLQSSDIGYLSEMMNFPGAISGDTEVLKKIDEAKKLNKPVDGHAPGLRGESLKQYISRGISTDHECFTIEEAREKLELGMRVLIREGSAAKNFEALIPLMDAYSDQLMFCSDYKHPDGLAIGHINSLCARAVEKGYDVFDVLKAACVNPAVHYRIPVGQLRVGDSADFIVVENLYEFRVRSTYIKGNLVAHAGISHIDTHEIEVPELNRFYARQIDQKELEVLAAEAYTLPVIGCLDGQLITEKLNLSPACLEGKWVSNTERDVLKLVVVNRYQQAQPAISFIHRFGLKKGAIASSVAHDSHNIVAVGVDDQDLLEAIQLVMENKGGISCVGNGKSHVLPLPIGGLMSKENGYAVAEMYTTIDQFAKSLGSTLASPFMSLSFMALLVIPHVKLSDRGLFDGDRFEFYQPLTD